MISRPLSVAALWLLRGIATLPYPLVARIGRALGTLTWRLAGRRRRIAEINLRLCFPQLSEQERNELVREHFRCALRSFVERFIFWYQPAHRIESLVRIEGAEHYHERLGRPLILLAPHFVGIDAGGIRLGIERRLATMYARQKNPVLNEAMRRGRERFQGAAVISRQDGIRAAVRVLREGTPFYFLPDMDLGPRDAVFVPFFGVPAATVTSTARLAALTGAAVVPCVTTMTDTGYVVRFYPAWTDFPADDPVAATRRMNEFIEERVREMPAQYWWTHKRFKTRPPGEPGFYPLH